MLQDEIKDSEAFKAVTYTIEKFTSLGFIEQDKLQSLKITEYFISTIPDFVPNDIVINSLKSVENLINKICGKNNTPLTSAIGLYQQLLSITTQNDAAKSKLIQEKYKNPSLLQQLRGEFNSIERNGQTFESWVLEAKLIQPQRDQLKQLINSALQQYEGEMRKPLLEFMFIFSIPRIRDIENDIQQLKKLKSESESILQEIQTNDEKAKTLVSYIADGAIKGHYKKQADAEAKAATHWRIASITTILIAIAWLLGVIFWGFNLYDNVVFDSYRFLLYFIPRGSVTICAIGLATYFGKQASNHQKKADLFMNRGFALQAVSPYLDDIKDESNQPLINSKQKVIETLLETCK